MSCQQLPRRSWRPWPLIVPLCYLPVGFCAHPAGVFSPQDAVDFAQREMAEKGRDPKQTCNRLLHEAIRERRCKDNCTVMLVKFG